MILSCSCRARGPTSGLSKATVAAMFCTLSQQDKEHPVHRKPAHSLFKGAATSSLMSQNCCDRGNSNYCQTPGAPLYCDASPGLGQEALDALHLTMAVLDLLGAERLLGLRVHVALWDQHLLGQRQLPQRQKECVKSSFCAIPPLIRRNETLFFDRPRASYGQEDLTVLLMSSFFFHPRPNNI